MNFEWSVSARAHAQFTNTHRTKTQDYVPHGWNNWYTSAYIQKLLYMRIDPSGWKGSVSYGLGADISLPQCLATGIWSLDPKAITGPKSRGTSFGTTLWHHVQRYCAQFLVFMLIQWSFLRERNFSRTYLLKESFLPPLLLFLLVAVTGIAETILKWQG